MSVAEIVTAAKVRQRVRSREIVKSQFSNLELWADRVRAAKADAVPREPVLLATHVGAEGIVMWAGHVRLTIAPRAFGDFADGRMWWAAFALGWTPDAHRRRAFAVGYGARPWDALFELVGFLLELEP